MRLAIIDLGTNTFNLLIADVDVTNQAFTAMYSTKQAVKLGEGGLMDGRIRPEPMQRAKNALAEYMHTVRQHECVQVLAFGTSAMRDSMNAGELVSWAAQNIGLEINVISGAEEARLITEGVRLAVKMDHRPALIMDIGGGSTEFVIANAQQVFWQKSYQLGISRLRQKLAPSDPVTASDLENFAHLLHSQLTELVTQCHFHGVRTLVGSSGSFDSFMEMIWASKGFFREVKEVRSDTFVIAELQGLNHQLLSLGFAERKQIPGLVEMRVDTIHLASFMVHWVLEQCLVSEVVLSTYSLKEGIIHQVMQGRAVEVMPVR